MHPIYKTLMLLSQDLLDIYRYILSRSMKDKDYETALLRLKEVFDGVDWIRSNLEKYRDVDNYDVFIDHLRHTEFVSRNLETIVKGLQSKANRSGKYGMRQYRKDYKNLDEAYDLFELSGNYLNTLSDQYT